MGSRWASSRRARRTGLCVQRHNRVKGLSSQVVHNTQSHEPRRRPRLQVPIGLSLGKVVSVDLVRGSVVFEGLDLVDGTPVLDIKPYVPFCDGVAEPRAPYWCAFHGRLPYIVINMQELLRVACHLSISATLFWGKCI